MQWSVVGRTHQILTEHGKWKEQEWNRDVFDGQSRSASGLSPAINIDRKGHRKRGGF